LRYVRFLGAQSIQLRTQIGFDLRQSVELDKAAKSVVTTHYLSDHLGSNIATVDAEAFSLAGWNPPVTAGASFSASLRLPNGEIRVTSPGCTRLGDFMWTLDALEVDAAPALARFTRRRVSSVPRKFAWDQEFEASAADPLVGEDAVELTIERVEMISAGVWTLRVQVGDVAAPSTLDVQRERPREQGLAPAYVVTPSTTDRADACGCQVVRLRIGKPSARVFPAHDGAIIKLGATESASFGGLLFRYSGLGEMVLIAGEDAGLAGIEVRDSNGRVVASALCRIGEPCLLDSFVVRVEQADFTHARLVISRAQEDAPGIR